MYFASWKGLDLLTKTTDFARCGNQIKRKSFGIVPMIAPIVLHAMETGKRC